MRRRAAVLIFAAILIAILSGCSNTAKEKPANLSKDEKEKLIKQITLELGGRYPNDQGLTRIYGDIANTSKRHIISVTVTASDVAAKGKYTVYGTTKIEDIGSGRSKPFEITTGKSINEVKEEVILTVTEADFR